MFTCFSVHYYLSNSFLSCLLFLAGNPMGRVEKAALVKCGYHHVMVGHSQGYMVAHTHRVQSHPHRSVNLLKQCHHEYNQPEHKRSPCPPLIYADDSLVCCACVFCSNSVLTPAATQRHTDSTKL